MRPRYIYPVSSRHPYLQSSGAPQSLPDKDRRERETELRSKSLPTFGGDISVQFLERLAKFLPHHPLNSPLNDSRRTSIPRPHLPLLTSSLTVDPNLFAVSGRRLSPPSCFFSGSSTSPAVELPGRTGGRRTGHFSHPRVSIKPPPLCTARKSHTHTHCMQSGILRSSVGKFDKSGHGQQQRVGASEGAGGGHPFHAVIRRSDARIIELACRVRGVVAAKLSVSFYLIFSATFLE